MDREEHSNLGPRSHGLRSLMHRAWNRNSSSRVGGQGSLASSLGTGLAVCAAAWPCAAAHAQQSAVIDAQDLAPWVAAVRQGRADLVGMGDSNQLFGGHGWDDGFLRAVHEQLGLYATGLSSCGENRGVGAGVGWRWYARAAGQNPPLLNFGAPGVLDLAIDTGRFFSDPTMGMRPLFYVHIAKGARVGPGFSPGFVVEPNPALDVSSALRFHFVYGIFDTPGDGRFTPIVRIEDPPYTEFATGSTVLTRGPEGVPAHVASSSLDIPAAPRSGPIAFRFTSPSGEDLVGPLVFYYVYAEDPSRTQGGSFNTLYAVGGNSARDMAEAVQVTDPLTFRVFFGELRQRQGETKAVLVRINTGLNDRNETLPSRGEGFTPGNSPAAFRDNLQAIIDRLREVWAMAGWPEEELFFVITVSHPVDDPDDEQLLAYRLEAEAVARANPRTASVRLDRLTTKGEMLANGWYNAGGFDVNHLTRAGFENLASRELAAILSSACVADWDESGEVEPSDIRAFFDAYRDGNADADGNGETEPSDIGAFFTAYRRGC